MAMKRQQRLSVPEKIMPESTPIYVALKGKLESSNFLVSGIELIKIGENCHTAKTKSSSPEKAVQKYPSETSSQI